MHTIEGGEGRRLLVIARDSIATGLERMPLPQLDDPSPTLAEVRGAFVTLEREGRLRGCIGRVESEWPLWETVARMARAAAFEDPRFPPLDAFELPLSTIEVSALTPPRRISAFDEIEVGRHGLIVERGFHKGLLLPQVATDWDWNRDEFLEQTCLKAGLVPDAWRDPTTAVWVFAAEVFGEEDGP